MDEIVYRRLKRDFFIVMNVSIVIGLGLFYIAGLIELPMWIFKLCIAVLMGIHSFFLLFKKKMFVYFLFPRFQPLWQLEQEQLGEHAIRYRKQQGIIMLIITGLLLFQTLILPKEITFSFFEDSMSLGIVMIIVCALVNIVKIIEFRKLENKSNDEPLPFSKKNLVRASMMFIVIVPLAVVSSVIILFFVML
ncbi:hypothetical protein [Bacillus solimangrovi]|uniref:Uncharacterized protein n=1 Tax=Bacillus solimangrovi TaxID=1305675 RepID=A0A1E5LD62_9BACI|nr:hypothetical protein [Bacillus solimangrovi]OEH92000.1 hypothetical protein BFG57_17195 [Bacillus solimangrovi]